MTVLVLGAGTSLDYGYPTGLKLVELIIQQLEFQSESYDSQLLEDLKNFKPYSIDSFLNKFPEHDSEAKALIAKILFECENPNIQIPANRDLYRLLFHEIPEESYDSFKIISFNYDRSLEYYFSKALLPSKKSEEQAFKALQKLEIIHIHGRLPALPFEGQYELPNEREQYPYGFGSQGYLPKSRYGEIMSVDDPRNHFLQFDVQQRKSRIQQHGRSFKTVFQNHETHQRAKEILDTATRIFFLGFGYHELNLRVLGLDWAVPHNKKIFGTAYGMNNVKKAEVKYLAPIIKLLNCDNMSLFSDHHSLASPDLVVTT